MARDTNFYYSFLVLTPARRQAIVGEVSAPSPITSAGRSVPDLLSTPSATHTVTGHSVGMMFSFSSTPRRR